MGYYTIIPNFGVIVSVCSKGRKLSFINTQYQQSFDTVGIAIMKFFVLVTVRI